MCTPGSIVIEMLPLPPTTPVLSSCGPQTIHGPRLKLTGQIKPSPCFHPGLFGAKGGGREKRFLQIGPESQNMRRYVLKESHNPLQLTLFGIGNEYKYKV